jgi:hypothetical protein
VQPERRTSVAASATIARAIVTAANAAGSCGLTLKSRVAAGPRDQRERNTGRDAEYATVMPSRTTSQITSLAAAPRAILTPISRRRSVTA